MPPRFAKPAAAALPLYPVAPEGLDALAAGLPGPARAWIGAQSFGAGPGEVLLLPGEDGGVAGALVGLGPQARRARTRFAAAAAATRLPAGDWRLAGELSAAEAEEAALGWLLEGYRFTRYKAGAEQGGGQGGAAEARLVAPEGVDAGRLEAIAEGEWLTRDLINIPANDMGPAELEEAARKLGARFGAEVTVTGADELLANDLPLIHTVGRAAAPHRAPRLIDMRWGDAGPALTLVGKGVCFDTGGLNLKPGASMALMKKDMGGAATVLGLAHMIMATGTPVRLRVLIPAVENAVAGDAFRPGDILPSRKGLSVEINNTDAEGRLVLADALALADEEPGALVVSMATLTGAARVALGPDLAPFYATDDASAAALAEAGAAVADPVWRLPYHEPYEAMIEPQMADLDNAPSGGMAGSITAALFLRRFVTETPRYMHFDIYGWNQAAAPGRPKGGVGMGARALFAALPKVLEL
ncbi:cytosol aminopeptidase family protein [Oceanicola granulosus HTCC2516]|uniref:Cytosol aminopeptidase family protein n=1 Tax=Oceanicola granulosus (strain ATCC BAA-861 / DSM 15982 / KCTC 12143 / HTCC2516) TaxID=314256 RepID=Q2CCU8_OCEGH|nr:leucyl aminopeptidase family protein [Oceanicola granulosus]EAR50525.1 cytosol aminopeptidase family protein [Oceanicola granulosus HTCC2516]